MSQIEQEPVRDWAESPGHAGSQWPFLIDKIHNVMSKTKYNPPYSQHIWTTSLPTVLGKLRTEVRAGVEKPACHHHPLQICILYFVMGDESH